LFGPLSGRADADLYEPAFRSIPHAAIGTVREVESGRADAVMRPVRLAAAVLAVLTPTAPFGGENDIARRI
jgi:hypothetical protein